MFISLNFNQLEYKYYLINYIFASLNFITNKQNILK